ncbi:MAG: aminotransferase class I/II-fold pyridoxal phosphate-dependent enzyme [Bacteroidetes bacterium]|nr:MAG: aminotransferase class I/II-fold pyridoxal phosphate-dependent enzyme [Bacteroidota bacterium]
MKEAFSLTSKLPQTGTTIFTVMSAMAREFGAINLSQGFPDFACDPALTEAVSRAMASGHNQYAPMPGLPALREVVAQRVRAGYGATYDPDTEVTITSGATEALFCAIHTVVQPGDEVILFEPAYDAYAPAIRLAGGIPVPLPLRFPGYAYDWDRVQAHLSPRTRAIVINSPHNPTGTLLQDTDLDVLAELCDDRSVWLIGDEVYEHIVFDGQAHQSLCRRPELAARSFVVSSFGKTLHATGWKVGYCLAPAALMVEFRKIHQFVTFSTATPLQHAIAIYLREHWDKIMGLSAFYQAKRDLFLDLMAGSRFVPLPSQGTYFQLMRYESISDRSEADFARWLTQEVGVACIPVSAFYEGGDNHGVVRFCFAKEDETLRAAAHRLRGL